MMNYIHTLNPVFFHLGPLAIRWYGLAYCVGIVLGWLILKRTAKNTLSESAIEELVYYVVYGILLGGRLGYCLFYNPYFYYHNPKEILMVWHGGMSFHGGLVGVVIALYCFAQKHQKSLLTITDLITPTIPIGLFFGRIANFINAELIGRPCEGNAFCIIYPAIDDIPRYPSQLYEACGEGLLLGIMLWVLRTRMRLKGMVSAMFILMYGLIRLLLEQFRAPDIQLGYLNFGLTMGQYLSMIMVLTGLCLVYIINKTPKDAYGL